MKKIYMLFTSLILLSLASISNADETKSNPSDGQKNRVEDAYNFRIATTQVATSGVINEEQLGNLKAEGYIAVINLLPKNNDNAIASEKKIVKDQGLDYHNIQVDWEEPTRKDYTRFAKVMDTYKAALKSQDEEQKVIVHCAANFRASAFFAIYAYDNLGWNEKQMADYIASVWNPEEYPAWDMLIKEKMLSVQL